MQRRANNSIVRSTSGATVVEYAIILPVLLLLIMGIVEYNTMMYATSILEGATISAARAGSTGYINATSSGTCPSPVVGSVVTPQTQAQYINCLVSTHVSGLLDTTKLQVSYNDTGTSTYNSTTDAPTYAVSCTDNPALANPPTFPLCTENSQSAGDIVIYTVTYPWNIYTPFLRVFLGTNGIYTISSSAIVKNEPYSTSSTR